MSFSRETPMAPNMWGNTPKEYLYTVRESWIDNMGRVQRKATHYTSDKPNQEKAIQSAHSPMAGASVEVMYIGTAMKTN